MEQMQLDEDEEYRDMMQRFDRHLLGRNTDSWWRRLWDRVRLAVGCLLLPFCCILSSSSSTIE
jgi:hypothetical protein